VQHLAYLEYLPLGQVPDLLEVLIRYTACVRGPDTVDVNRLLEEPLYRLTILHVSSLLKLAPDCLNQLARIDGLLRILTPAF
jgi:hypothetical protein